MRRFTIKQFRYPEDSPLERLQELENQIEDGKLIEVVRCSECTILHNKWTGCPKLNGMVTPSDFYCSFGERRKSDEDMVINTARHN